VNRKTIIVALAGALTLGAAAALYVTLGARLAGTPGSRARDAAGRRRPGRRARRRRAAAASAIPSASPSMPTAAVFVADGGDSNRIRRIDRDGLVSTFAGGREGFADGPGAAAAFHTPSALAFDRFGNLYVADTGNHAIRKIAPDGSVTTLAGDGQPGDADGIGARRALPRPVGVAVDLRGNVYVADTYNDRIRRIAPDGSVTTIAGGGSPARPTAGCAAAFDTPSGIAVDKDGVLFVADTGNNAIRRIGADGVVTHLAPAGGRAPAGPAAPDRPRAHA
jgi:glucose/arabinose dehydrogenase